VVYLGGWPKVLGIATLPLIVIKLNLLASDWYINTLNLVLAVGLAALFALHHQTQSTFSKVKLLGLQLLLLGIVFLQTKNEQYLPLYLLVEFGTVTFLYSVYKNITHQTRPRSVPQAFFYIPTAIILGIVVTQKNVYWVDIYQHYLALPTASGDFDSLKLMIVTTGRQILVPVFTFIFVTTLVLIMINSCYRGPDLVTLKTRNQSPQLANKFDEPGSKIVDPLVITFKK
jgi:hypothetical protein